MSKIKSVCVFCGSQFGVNAKHKDAAAKVGRILSEEGLKLVYGGGRIGLMGIIADSVLESGGEVIGVIPKFLEELEIGNMNASSLIVTDDMHSRKQKMFERADAFLAMPGGLGTLEEIFEIITWKQLKLHSKPIIILNTDHYWSGLIKVIEDTISGGFTKSGSRELITILDEPEGIRSFLKNH